MGFESFSKVLHQFCKAEVIINPAGEKRKLNLGGDGAMPGLKPGVSGVVVGKLLLKSHGLPLC